MKQGGSPKLVGLVVAMVLVLVYLVVLRPQGASLSEAREEREGLATELAQLERSIEQRDAEPADADPRAALLDAAVPATAELSNLFRQLDTIATESGMQQTSITPSALSAGEGQPGGSLQVTLALSGPSAGAGLYLQRLATLQRLFVVEQYSLQRRPAGAGADPDALVQLQLSGRVFTTELPAAGPDEG